MNHKNPNDRFVLSGWDPWCGWEPICEGTREEVWAAAKAQGTLMTVCIHVSKLNPDGTEGEIVWSRGDKETADYGWALQRCPR